MDEAQRFKLIWQLLLPDTGSIQFWDLNRWTIPVPELELSGIGIEINKMELTPCPLTTDLAYCGNFVNY